MFLFLHKLSEISSLFFCKKLQSVASVIYISYLLKGRGINRECSCSTTLAFLKLSPFRKGKRDTTTELRLLSTVTPTLPLKPFCTLHFTCASVFTQLPCVLLMDVFLDVCPTARDADEREKWIQALEGTILRHTLQQVRP